MVDVEVLAVMLVGVETTIYAVSMALYIALKQNVPLPPSWTGHGPASGDDVVRDHVWPGIVQAYGRYTLAFLSAAFAVALVLTFVTLATGNTWFAFLGAGGFGASYASFLWVIEFRAPRRLQRLTDPRNKR